MRSSRTAYSPAACAPILVARGGCRAAGLGHGFQRTASQRACQGVALRSPLPSPAITPAPAARVSRWRPPHMRGGTRYSDVEEAAQNGPSQASPQPSPFSQLPPAPTLPDTGPSSEPLCPPSDEPIAAPTQRDPSFQESPLAPGPSCEPLRPQSDAPLRALSPGRSSVPSEPLPAPASHWAQLAARDIADRAHRAGHVPIGAELSAQARHALTSRGWSALYNGLIWSAAADCASDPVVEWLQQAAAGLPDLVDVGGTSLPGPSAVREAWLCLRGALRRWRVHGAGALGDWLVREGLETRCVRPWTYLNRRSQEYVLGQAGRSHPGVASLENLFAAITLHIGRHPHRLPPASLVRAPRHGRNGPRASPAASPPQASLGTPGSPSSNLWELPLATAWHVWGPIAAEYEAWVRAHSALRPATLPRTPHTSDPCHRPKHLRGSRRGIGRAGLPAPACPPSPVACGACARSGVGSGHAWAG